MTFISRSHSKRKEGAVKQWKRGARSTVVGLGERQITGTVKGNKVVFGYEGKREGQTLKITYTGTIESPTKMTDPRIS